MMNNVQKRAHTYFLGCGFVPADKESHAAIKEFNADNLLYEMTACITVTWSDVENTLYKIIDGFLCTVHFYQDGEISFFIRRQAGVHNLQHIIDTLYDISQKAGLEKLPVWAIEERFLDDYRDLKGYNVEISYDDAVSEYVYSAESLLELNGKSNRNKRRQLEKFINKTNVSVQAITKENVNLCLDIDNRWCSLQDCNLCRSFAGCQKKSLEIMIDIFDDYLYQGIFGYIDETIAGYLIFEKTSEELAFLHIAKTAIPNFSVYLYYTGVQRYLSNVKYINIGADLGIQGLRDFKCRLGVHELWKKYHCTFIKG